MEYCMPLSGSRRLGHSDRRHTPELRRSCFINKNIGEWRRRLQCVADQSGGHMFNYLYCKTLHSYRRRVLKYFCSTARLSAQIRPVILYQTC